MKYIKNMKLLICFILFFSFQLEARTEVSYAQINSLRKQIAEKKDLYDELVYIRKKYYSEVENDSILGGKAIAASSSQSGFFLKFSIFSLLTVLGLELSLRDYTETAPKKGVLKKISHFFKKARFTSSLIVFLFLINKGVEYKRGWDFEYAEEKYKKYKNIKNLLTEKEKKELKSLIKSFSVIKEYKDFVSTHQIHIRQLTLFDSFLNILKRSLDRDYSNLKKLEKVYNLSDQL